MDRAGVPFVAAAALPTIALTLAGWPGAGAALLVLPIAIGLFFRDPVRRPPSDPLAVLSPADGRVMHAGDARPAEAPPGRWRQVTIFLSPLDVHINRSPVAGRVTRVDFHPGTFLPAYRHDAHGNEHSEIWIDRAGQPVVARQVVGAMARRVVCRVKAGDALAAGDRIGLMKFGSRMDVFLPGEAELAVRAGDRVRGGETIIARLPALPSAGSTYN